MGQGTLGSSRPEGHIGLRAPRSPGLRRRHTAPREQYMSDTDTTMAVIQRAQLEQARSDLIAKRDSLSRRAPRLLKRRRPRRLLRTRRVAKVPDPPLERGPGLGVVDLCGHRPARRHRSVPRPPGGRGHPIGSARSCRQPDPHESSGSGPSRSAVRVVQGRWAHVPALNATLVDTTHGPVCTRPSGTTAPFGSGRSGRSARGVCYVEIREIGSERWPNRGRGPTRPCGGAESICGRADQGPRSRQRIARGSP